MSQIFGIDFTSAPRKAKPIICVESRLEDNLLRIVQIRSWTSFEPFETFLQSNGPWIAGMDFPFSQPNEFLKRANLKTAWNEYVKQVGEMSKAEFADLLERDSKAARPGSKHLFRKTDRIASACSPMMIYGVPVAKMFYEGATRLRNANVSVLPCRPRNVDRVAIETYPAIVARHFIGRTTYKSGSKKEGHQDRTDARAEVVKALSTKRGETTFGFRVRTSTATKEELTSDDSGDSLDAVGCCVLAAWASRQPNFGIPRRNSKEGWIIGADHFSICQT